MGAIKSYMGAGGSCVRLEGAVLVADMGNGGKWWLDRV